MKMIIITKFNNLNNNSFSLRVLPLVKVKENKTKMRLIISIKLMWTTNKKTKMIKYSSITMSTSITKHHSLTEGNWGPRMYPNHNCNKWKVWTRMPIRQLIRVSMSTRRSISLRRPHKLLAKLKPSKCLYHQHR